LNKYKFVNTKRKWDRESRWLLKNIVNNSNLTYEEKLLNCILFRVINKWETFELLWWAFNFLTENIDFENIRKILRILESRRIISFFTKRRKKIYFNGYGKQLSLWNRQKMQNIIFRKNTKANLQKIILKKWKKY